ncbi:SUKH superfamily protein [Streptomyces sp. CG 926]|uniref:SMI1/KNR4 family protein n=1 Tax=Streptomyces sp. CG 926 TaxID=1882405 RepID=UPI000D6D8EED|nr:SMI1/KNR4 family protein [Streptomyces sp. CG 926]PWK66717.1 SUKH superfamily protein [Streptomyces sp. CG 926]
MNLGTADFATADPERPPSPVAADWRAIEAWLGLAAGLPSDFKQLADAHGPVDFGAYIWIHTPCVEADRFDYGTWLHETHRTARIQLHHLPEEERYAVHPEPGGLLAWGVSRGGDTLFWDTSRSADPDAWGVVVHHRGAVPGSGLRVWHAYDLTLTEYLRHTVRDGWELPSPPGPLMGPLPGSLARTAFLPDARPWSPPAPVVPRLTEAQRRVALRTGTGLEALELLSPPPAEPYLGGDSWDGLFAELGTVLPREYVTLMQRYGAGSWGRWLRFFTPLRTRDHERRFVVAVEEVLDGYRQLRTSYPDAQPLAVWPEPGGFLPFANSIDGDQLGWLTEGTDPEAWPLVVWPRHADQGPPLESGLIDTLLAWQRGTLTAPGLPGLDRSDDPVECAGFAPWDTGAYW